MSGHVLWQISRRLDENSTNNVAEYEALREGLTRALGQGWKKIHAFSDSELLVKHFHVIFDIKYTASLEGHLDKVENGTEKRQNLLEKFWAKLSAGDRMQPAASSNRGRNAHRPQRSKGIPVPSMYQCFTVRKHQPTGTYESGGTWNAGSGMRFDSTRYLDARSR